MRVPAGLRPLYARKGVSDPTGLLRAIFEAGDFALGDGGMRDGSTDVAPRDAWRHSLLTATGQTNIIPLRLPRLKGQHETLPRQFDWADQRPITQTPEPKAEPWQAFAFGGSDRSRGSHRNDFLLERSAPSDAGGKEASDFLCQLLAHRRSQLFGLPLARSTFNVLLPHATLEEHGSEEEKTLGPRLWLAQPMVSLFHVYARGRFRPTFSFSVFLVPCACTGGEQCARKMRASEIRESVKSQWPLATAFDDPDNRPTFSVQGPLTAYLSAASGPSLESLGLPTSEEWPRSRRLTLRKFTEATLFSLAAAMSAGPGASLRERSRRALGDRIVTSLSASRVSSVAVVGEGREGEEECRLDETVAGLGGLIATPLKSRASALRTYRLDDYLFDRRGYASAVLPDDRCVITVGATCVQRGLDTSLLLETGWTAYMVIGAATATGLIRSVFREIAESDRAKPDRIADIEREALVDLHETYDIEITVEAYRMHYGRLRQHLGINAEYEALSSKLQALFRETSTRYEARSERRLTLLTWAIVILSAFILAGTLALIFKSGG